MISCGVNPFVGIVPLFAQTNTIRFTDMDSAHTLILAILTVEGSYSQDIERPATSVADTVQFWYAPNSQWRIKTYAIDHDIHVHSIGIADPLQRLTVAFAEANIQKTYGDVVERLTVLSIPDPMDVASVRKVLDSAGLGGGLEIVPDGYAFYNPDRGHYRSQSKLRTPSAQQP